MTSPAWTWSPSFTCQALMIPCSIVGDKAGIFRISCGGSDANSLRAPLRWQKNALAGHMRALREEAC